MKSRLGLSKENAIFQATELMNKYGKVLSQKLNKNILYSYYEQYDIRTSGYVPNVKEGMDMIRIGKSDLEEHRVFFKNVVDTGKPVVTIAEYLQMLEIEEAKEQAQKER